MCDSNGQSAAASIAASTNRICGSLTSQLLSKLGETVEAKADILISNYTQRRQIRAKANSQLFRDLPTGAWLGGQKVQVSPCPRPKAVVCS